MNHVVLLLIFSLAQFSGIAQNNIVPNHSFEEHLACPKYDVKYRDSFNRFFNDWYDPTSGTPDYYNVCGTLDMGIPKNLIGDQDPYEGEGYIGMLTSNVFESHPVDGIYTNWREYVSVAIPELEVGATYNVSMWLSLADKSEYATEAPSVLFSKDYEPDVLTTKAIPIHPQVSYGHYGFIDNRKDWVQVSQNFVADSNYNKITIGNFVQEDKDIKLKSSYNYTVWEGIKMSYYFIDNVAVRKIADRKEGDFSISFNSNGALMIYGAADQPTGIKIFNVAGQVVYQNEVQPNFNFIKTEIELQPYLATGVYLVKIVSGSKASTLKCLIP